MWSPLISWLDHVTIADPIERRQAGLVQVMLLGLAAAAVIATPIAFASSAGEGQSVSLALRMAALLLIIVTAVAALFLVRGGRFRGGVLLSALGMIGGLAAFAVLQGVLTNIWIMLALTVPISLVGLLLGRWALVGAIALAAAVLGAIGAAEAMPGQIVGFAPSVSRSWSMALISFVMLAAVLGLFFDRFSSMLRTSLAESLARERELERLRAGLEEAVQKRTAELQTTVDQLRASQETIRELGAPVLPVLPGVLVAPLIGALDTARAADLSAAVLEAIDRTRARHLILDITGVPVVDTHVARALLRVAQAARLLGTQPALVGVRAEVAQTMVTLGLDLGDLAVFPNLQEAVAALQQARLEA